MPKKKKKSQLAEYSQLGIEMAVIITAFFFIGNTLDSKEYMQKPYGTLVFTLSGIILSMVRIIKKGLQKPEDD